RLWRPRPVKYALPWLERFEPSTTNTPEELKPQRVSNASRRVRSESSASGEKRLNSGAMNAGHAQLSSSHTASQTHQNQAHHHRPACCITNSTNSTSGPASSTASKTLLPRSTRNSTGVVRLKPKRASRRKVRHSDSGRLRAASA